MLAIGLTLAYALLGDTLVLRNGSRVSGKLLSAQRGAILFAPQGGQNRRFNMDEVDEVARIEFNSTELETRRIGSIPITMTTTSILVTISTGIGPIIATTRARQSTRNLRT